MGRVREEVEVDGYRCWALFDTGAMNTFVVEEVASLLPTFTLEEPERLDMSNYPDSFVEF